MDMLPVFFVITNDGDQPIRWSDMKAQLKTKDRSKLIPATEDDLLRRLSHPSRTTGSYAADSAAQERGKGRSEPKDLDEIERAVRGEGRGAAQLAGGFLFFDVADIPNPLAGAIFT